MYQYIKDVVLKTGEQAKLGIVIGPDLEWAAKIEHLLGHKGEPWNWQIHKCLQNADTGFESRCYILSKDARPIANICTFEAHGVGIFGHVFTVPDERKKGAADHLNQQVMRDFCSRGGQALYLGTTYDSPAYHIYRKYGFTSVEPESGYMVYTRDDKEAFEKKFFEPGPTILEPLAFKHWPILSTLTMMSHPARIRVLSMGIIGARSTEGGCLEILKKAEDQNQSVRAWVAVSEKTKAVIAFACLHPDCYFGSSIDLLDVFWAPGFDREALEAIESLPVSGRRKLTCYSDSAWPEKEKVLTTAGFKSEATLHEYITQGNKLLNIKIWSK